jgi:hypothetical protein
MESLKKHGWMENEYAYGIAPQGATVVNGELILPVGLSHVSCVDPLDGLHRLTAATELQEQTGHEPCKVPTILFEFGIPHSVWLPFAFARMEMNQYSDMYTTVDLLHVIQLVENNREDSGLSDTPNPKDIHEAIYGKSLENNEAPSSQSTLTEDMIKDFYIFYARLKSFVLLDFVSQLGSKNHSIEASKCHSLLDNQVVAVFEEGKSFLAPLLKLYKADGKATRLGRGGFFPLTPRYNGLFLHSRDTPFGHPELKELMLWAYSKWLLSGGEYPSIKDWYAANTAIKNGATDLQTLHAAVENSMPPNVDLFTLELLAVQPGLLAQAASKQGWQKLLEKKLTTVPIPTTATIATTATDTSDSTSTSTDTIAIAADATTGSCSSSSIVVVVV